MTDLEGYKPNSHKYKKEQQELAERKKLEKVVTGNVQVKKKTELAKIADAFIAEDPKSVGSSLISDVVIPGIVNLLEDLVVKGVRMLLRGDAGRSSSKRDSIAGKVSYRKYYDERDERPSGRVNRAVYEYDKIVIPDRAEAIEVLERLKDQLETYGEVSVGDLYDVIGVTCDFTAYNYGWVNLHNAEVVRASGGYVIKLPKVLPLKH